MTTGMFGGNTRDSHNDIIDVICRRLQSRSTGYVDYWVRLDNTAPSDDTDPSSGQVICRRHQASHTGLMNYLVRLDNTAPSAVVPLSW